MARVKKRKHDGSDAEYPTEPAELNPQIKKTKNRPKTQSVSASASDTPRPAPELVAKHFDVFAQALSNILSIASSSESVLRDAVGDEKANLVMALRAMSDTGDIDWLNSVPPSSTYTIPDEILSGPSHTTAASPVVPFTPPSKVRPSSTSHQPTTWPPPLPIVRNESLLTQAFTHKSYIKGEDASSPGVEQKHYERLEFLGDSYLQSISSQILYDRFPTLREGALSDMRQQLVANRSLNTYAMVYKFHTKLREGRGQELTVPGYGRDMSKTLADAFEAFIAAVVLDSPLSESVETASAWLTQLFEPKLKEMETQHMGVEPVDKMAKQSLNNIVGGQRVVIEYRWTAGKGGNKGGYWYTVLLNGWGYSNREIGRGWGTSKNDAALRAAMNAISNKPLCQEIAARKQQILGVKPSPAPTSSSSSSTPAFASQAPPPAPAPPLPPLLESPKRPILQSGDILNYED